MNIVKNNQNYGDFDNLYKRKEKNITFLRKQKIFDKK